MDTGMQETIRSAEPEAFKDLDRFKEYKEKGMLRKPETVGNALVDLILGENIINGKIYNVNDLLR
jgi:benzil reductase ((S)-benzoin forming)